MTPAHVKSFLSGTKEPLRNAAINRLTELGLDWEDRVDALWRLAEGSVVVVVNRPGYCAWWTDFNPERSGAAALNSLPLST